MITCEVGQLLMFDDAIQGRKVIRIVAIKNSHPTPMKPAAMVAMTKSLHGKLGEWYQPGMWAASHDSAKSLGYRTIMVTLEEEAQSSELDKPITASDINISSPLRASDFRICTLYEALSQPGMKYESMRTSKNFCVSPKTSRKAEPKVASKIKADLMHQPGRLNAAGTEWKALNTSCKAIGYTLVVVNIVQDDYPVPMKPMPAKKQPAPSLVESVIWIRTETCTPDEGVVVLLFHPDSSEPVWPGVFEGVTADGYAWSHADGTSIKGQVVAWAELPSGPRI